MAYATLHGRCAFENKNTRTGLEVGVGGKAIVGAGGSETDTGSGVAFGEPVGEFVANAGLEFDEWGRKWRR